MLGSHTSGGLFSVVYTIHDHDNSSGFSLRSTDKHVDVSEIASTFGGGGHRNSSGLYLNCVTNTLPGIVYDNGSLYENLQNLYFEEKNIGLSRYNVVYLYSTTHKSKLGKYLLQTKYIEKDTKMVVQNCNAILMEKYGSRQYDMSVVWDYDPFKETTKFVFTFNPYMSESVIGEICRLLGLDNKRTLILTGCRKFLPDV